MLVLSEYLEPFYHPAIEVKSISMKGLLTARIPAEVRSLKPSTLISTSYLIVSGVISIIGSL